MTNREQIEQAVISAGSYTGNDTEKLRERNVALERKAQAFDEIALTVLSEDNDVIKNMNNIVTKIVINNLEREE